jgi:hypothetical protein
MTVMPDTVRIPWLRDQHSHASLYASLRVRLMVSHREH